MPSPRVSVVVTNSYPRRQVHFSRHIRLWSVRLLLAVALAATSSFITYAQAPTPGQNVNMVSGTKWPGGDPFLQRQNEPSIAVSTRNPQHLLVGANDYRTVDLNFFATGETGDAWLGLFKSFDGGATWQSTLLPGYPLDNTSEGLASPLKGFTAASDPVVRPGTNGLFFYSGIAFNRGTNVGVAFVSRLIDLNNKENGNAAPSDPSTENTDPIRYISTVTLDKGNAGQFLDKPWVVADIPRLGAGSCTITVPEPGAPGGTATQSFPAGNVYVAWTRFVGGQNMIRTQIYVSRSLDCGATWSTPDKVSEGYPVNQGVTMAIDPKTGFLYVAWRTFAAASTPDGISVAVSTDGGQTFSKGIQVISLPSFNPTTLTAPSFFDLQSSGTQMRTLAFPTIAVDNASRVYVAWAQRVGPYGDARIMISNSTTNGLTWTTPMAIDNQPVEDDFFTLFPRGHQLMPQLTFSGGKLMALYYDLRLDHTLGFFTPNDPFVADSPLGRFYREARTPEGELPGNSTAVFTPYLDDAGLTKRRHTIEVFVVQANPGSPPSFSPGTRVTSYRFGLRNDLTDLAGELQQLQVDPPNFPLFKGGTTPFFGDYIDIAGLTMVPQANGSWGFNTGNVSTKTGSTIAPVFHATWTDNRDVRPPKNGNWQNYTPVGGGGQSIFSPGTTTPFCAVNQEGMRNQNIYTSGITQGLLVSSPQNSKPLSASLQRAFVVLVQNQTNFDRSFRLTIANQPPGGFASFIAGKNNPPNPPTPPPTSTGNTTLDAQVPAHSGVVASVFAVSTSPTASITVNVDEISAPPGGTLVSGGLSSFVVLNPDATTPPLINADGAPANTDIASLEIYNPNFSNPNYSNPNYSNRNSDPNFSNPNYSNPNFSNPNFSNLNFSNPDIAGSTVPTPNYSNGDLTNPNYSNPNYSNPNFSNTNLTTTSVSDASYTLTNEGNTSAGYDVNLVLAGQLPGNAQFQLLINKTYLTPVAHNCALGQEQTTNVASVINNPNFSNPNFSNPNFSNSSLSLAPGESATVTLRGFNVTCSIGPRCKGPISGVANIEDIVAQVAPVVTAQAANTNDPTNIPPTVAPLFITTAALPGGVAGQQYAPPSGAQLQAIGGTAPYTWLSLSNLPPGLNLDPSTGLISGAPDTSAGTFTFTVQVTDSTTPTPNTATRQLSITVVNPLFIGEFSPNTAGVTGQPYGGQNIRVTGGTPPYTRSISSGALPGGVTLNPSTGVLSGTPTTIGTFIFTVQITDSSPTPLTATTTQLTIVVTSPSVAFGLTFIVQPTNTVAGVVISPPVQVKATDTSGAVLPFIAITISIGSNPSGGILSGTTPISTDSTGVATFTDLKIDKAGSGYTLVASALSGTIVATSNPFSITGSPVNIAAGALHTCALLSDGTVECWGDNTFGELGKGTAGPTTGSSTPVVVSGLSGATAIAAGGFHTCALLSNGTAQCWGYNSNGQLGNGTTTDSSIPVAVSGLSGATAIAAGLYHTCALLSNGTVQCWGYNSNGQLGNGTTTDSSIPVAVSGLSGATAIAARVFHTCALLSDGTAQCWGDNSYGDLGNGSMTGSTTPVVVSLPSGTTAIAIAAGGDHSCALLSNGTAQCWGLNNFGQLGNGTTTNSSTPVAVILSGGLSRATAIAAGSNHTCALLSDGTAQCWGYNGYGQLGSGTFTDSNTPVPVNALSGATAIAAGGYHTCALLSDGTGKCWGYNAYGQLGNGTLINSSIPVAVTGLGGLGGPTAAASAGGFHTCALLSNGTVECWGYNGFGQLGNGTTTDSSTPVAVSGLSGAEAISAGEFHTCALLSNGTVECWGNNNYDQLGNGTTTNASTPVAVTGLTGATAIAAGGDHTCALLSDGTVKCWGYNALGQLGNGTTINASTPVAVSGLTGATAIAAGGGQTCALLSDGTVKCWGYNAYGGLGNGTLTNSSTPVVVSGLSGATAIAAGGDHTCALLSGGAMQCWGYNAYGELGNGTTTNSSTPVAVTGLSGAKTISAGFNHTCALLSGGTMQCWGYNVDGRLGNGTTTNSSTPVAVIGLGGVKAISAGYFHTCAALGGTMQCWGSNGSGQLGNGTTANSSTPVAVTGLP